MQNDRQAFDNEPFGSETAIIGVYKTARKAHEAGLAVLASGQPYWIYPVEEGDYVLVVSRQHATRLQREVEIAEIRSRYWPPPSIELPTKRISKAPTGMAIVMLLIAFIAQNEAPFLKELGMNSSQGVLAEGQWWRIVTAITLHADVSHLAGNILSIAIFAYLCCRYMGNGLAWILILLAATAANLTNDLINAERAFFSLGASTACFAALGLLTGFPIGTYFRSKEPISTRDWLIPFSGGCILFAWLGGGDFPTDVAGHFWSFLYGLGLAILAAHTAMHAKLSQFWQMVLLSLALLIPLMCWGMALAH